MNMEEDNVFIQERDKNIQERDKNIQEQDKNIQEQDKNEVTNKEKLSAIDEYIISNKKYLPAALEDMLHNYENKEVDANTRLALLSGIWSRKERFEFEEAKTEVLNKTRSGYSEQLIKLRSKIPFWQNKNK